MPLAGHQLHTLQALQDRIHVIRYEPTEEQIISLMRHLADQGVGNVRSDDARCVLEFLLAECRRRDIPPSLRLFVDKAIPDFQMHYAQECELNWRDLIVSDLEQQLIQPVHPAADLSRADQMAAERRLVEALCCRFQTRAEQLAEWKLRTGKSQAAFYRRLKELEARLDAA